MLSIVLHSLVEVIKQWWFHCSLQFFNSDLRHDLGVMLVEVTPWLSLFGLLFIVLSAKKGFRS